jgi:hypothetical protein
MPKTQHWSEKVSDAMGATLDAIERHVSNSDAPDKGVLKELGDIVTKLAAAEQGHRLLEAKLKGARVDGD